MRSSSSSSRRAWKMSVQSAPSSVGSRGGRAEGPARWRRESVDTLASRHFFAAPTGPLGSAHTYRDSSRSGSTSDETQERVISVKDCPACHRPRQNKKAKMDIVAHPAVCKSGGRAKIDRVVVVNFIAASQAQSR